MTLKVMHRVLIPQTIKLHCHHVYRALDLDLQAAIRV